VASAAAPPDTQDDAMTAHPADDQARARLTDLQRRREAQTGPSPSGSAADRAKRQGAVALDVSASAALGACRHVGL